MLTTVVAYALLPNHRGEGLLLTEGAGRGSKARYRKGERCVLWDCDRSLLVGLCMAIWGGVHDLLKGQRQTCW